MKRVSCLIVALACVVLCGTAAADPGTRPQDLQPLPSAATAATSLGPQASFTGHVTLSIDAVGSNTGTGQIQVEKPIGGTVLKAYLAAASTGFTSYDITNTDIAVNGVPISWTLDIPNAISSHNVFTDATAILAPIIDAAPAGIVNLTVTENNTFNIDGVVLAVIFNDPSLTVDYTAVIMFGAQNVTGDDFTINLAQPADPANPAYVLDFSLGISYGHQPSSPSQVSLVDVNGQRMTSSAGGEDDGDAPDNGALITAGGIGDSNANPPDPMLSTPPDPRYDDELYNLKPFVTAGDHVIQVHTLNPSNDDNIFFSALRVSGAAVVNQAIVLSPATASNPIGTTHTVTATVMNSLAQPVVGASVTFTVISGPNMGLTGTAITNAAGQATFTYTSTLVGIDQIQASFYDAQQQLRTSNIVTKEWTPAPLFACPRSMGFWRQQCAQKGNGSTKVCLAGMQQLWSCVRENTGVIQFRNNDGTFLTTTELRLLGRTETFDALCGQLQGPRPMTQLDMAEIQYLALMLNVCSGALPAGIQVSNSFTGTVGAAIDSIENAINTGYNLGYWTMIADNLNNGMDLLAADCPNPDSLFRNMEACTDGQTDDLATRPGSLIETRAYPNPVMGGSASIYFRVPEGGAAVNVRIYDLAGRLVKNLLSDSRATGVGSVEWNLRDESGTRVPSGIYFYKVTAGREQVTQKILVE